MKILISRIESLVKSGTSKGGNPYSLDFTKITALVPFHTAEGFGFKEMTYDYGKAANFQKLESLRGALPANVEVEIGIENDQYGNPLTVITDVKVATATNPTPIK